MLDVDEVNAQLRPAFAALRRELHRHQAPEELEANLLSAFKQQHPPLPWWRVWIAEPWQWSGVLAMALLVIMTMLNQSHLTDMNGDRMAMAVNAGDQLDALYEDIPFIALDNGESILKQDNMRIVRADVPHTMLASLGIPVNPQTAGDSSKAEMLVGENNEYLALRFIPSE